MQAWPTWREMAEAHFPKALPSPDVSRTNTYVSRTNPDDSRMTGQDMLAWPTWREMAEAHEEANANKSRRPRGFTGVHGQAYICDATRSDMLNATDRYINDMLKVLAKCHTDGERNPVLIHLRALWAAQITNQANQMTQDIKRQFDNFHFTPTSSFHLFSAQCESDPYAEETGRHTFVHVRVVLKRKTLS